MIISGCCGVILQFFFLHRIVGHIFSLRHHNDYDSHFSDKAFFLFSCYLCYLLRGPPTWCTLSFKVGSIVNRLWEFCVQ